MKKVLVALTTGVLFVGSLFAFAPCCMTSRNVTPVYQQQVAQTTQALQTSQTTWARLYKNLPANSTLSEVKKYKGTIKEISWSTENGLELKVQVDKEVYTVHTGPIFRILEFKAEQEVEIAGRLVTSGSSKYIVAEEITTNGKTVKVSEIINAQRREIQKPGTNVASRSVQRRPNMKSKQKGPRI